MAPGVALQGVIHRHVAQGPIAAVIPHPGHRESTAVRRLPGHHRGVGVRTAIQRPDQPGDRQIEGERRHPGPAGAEHQEDVAVAEILLDESRQLRVGVAGRLLPRAQRLELRRLLGPPHACLLPPPRGCLDASRPEDRNLRRRPAGALLPVEGVGKAAAPERASGPGAPEPARRGRDPAQPRRPPHTSSTSPEKPRTLLECMRSMPSGSTP